MQRITKTYRSKSIRRVEKVFHTEKYKLNLIEPSDPFLPEALNANTRKLEEVVSGHLEGMDARVTVLEAHKFACGTYVGNYTGHGTAPDSGQFISLPFTPKAVLVQMANNSREQYSDFGVASSAYEPRYLRPMEGGFTAFYDVNYNESVFCFIAFA